MLSQVILRQKCTKIDFFWGSAPDTAGGVYSAPPDLLGKFKEEKKRVEKSERGKGMGRKGPPTYNGRVGEERGRGK